MVVVVGGGGGGHLQSIMHAKGKSSKVKNETLPSCYDRATNVQFTKSDLLFWASFLCAIS